MTFQTSEITDVFLVEDATQCYFDSVNFVGPLTAEDITSSTSTDDIAGVRFSSTETLVCSQITFDKCRFTGLSFGINTDQQITGVTVSNSAFEILYQGISLGATSPIDGGASGFRAVQNLFNQVYAEGIVYGDVSLNVSAHNIFYDVGNKFATDNTAYSIIIFSNDNNVSITDMFARLDVDAAIQPRVQVLSGISDTGTQIQLGRYARENGRTFSLNNNASNQLIFTTNTSIVKAYQMIYTVIRDSAIRTGTLTVAAQNSDDSSLTLSYTDDYTENFGTGVTLAVSQLGNVVSLKYSTTNTGLAGTLTYSIAYLA